jgi:hypothetical protein
MYNARLHRARRTRDDAPMGLGFFDLFFDDDYRQRSDINDLRRQESVVATDVAGLSQQIAALRKQVHDLSMTVAVMMKMLGEAGQLDPKIVRYRVEAELEAAEEATHKAPTAMVKCDRCKASVPANLTTLTETGQVCDRCAAMAR